MQKSQQNVQQRLLDEQSLWRFYGLNQENRSKTDLINCYIISITMTMDYKNYIIVKKM